MFFKSVILSLLFIFTFKGGYGQQIEFKASALDQVAVGDQFRLIFSVNAQATGFQAPAIKDFAVLSGPNPSSSTSMQVINNKVTRTVEYSYTYILQAIKEGSFTIASATVNVAGQAYQSNQVSITVVKGTTKPATDPNTAQVSPDISSKSLFLKATVNKNNPYQGEQVIVTYKLYTRVPVASPQFTRIPSLTGFWKENLLENNTTYNQYRENLNGQEYVVAEIKKDALFAQKSGDLVIEPLELKVTAQIEKKRRKSNDPFDDFFNDSFFGSNYQNVEKTLYSNAITLKVKPLPQNQKTGDFAGAVGNFKLNASIDKNKVKANDALTLKYTISGSGNIKLIDKPNINFPPDFEVYDPRIVDDIKTTTSGMAGTRTFEYLIVPRNHGNYTIKSLPFVYFDLNGKNYKTLNSPEFRITVEKGTGNDSYVRTGANKEDFQYIGTDIRFIKTDFFNLRPVNHLFFGTGIYWLLFLLPFILFVMFIIIWQKELKRRGNVALVRNKKATGIARKRLKAAEQFLKNGNQSAFCTEISNALWGYISDKFNISRSALSIDSVHGALKSKQVKEDLIIKFVSTLNNCEYVRFAPGDKTEVMAGLYTEAMEVITQTEQELK